MLHEDGLQLGGMNPVMNVDIVSAVFLSFIISAQFSPR
jgi:hypothetical protein